MPAEAPFFFFLLSSSSHLHRSDPVRWWWWIYARRQPPPFLLLPHLLFPILTSPPASNPSSAASNGAEAAETLPSHPHLPPRRPIETKLPLLPPNKVEANLRIPSLSSILEGKAAFNSKLCCFLLRRDLDNKWDVKPLLDGKAIMGVLQLKSGGPKIREWAAEMAAGSSRRNRRGVPRVDGAFSSKTVEAGFKFLSRKIILFSLLIRAMMKKPRICFNSLASVIHHFSCMVQPWRPFKLLLTDRVYALLRDRGVPFSSVWRKVHPKHKVPANAVWFCAAICILLGLPILKVNVVFTAITSICTIGWVGGYAVPIFARMVMADENFKPGPFYLGRARRPICLVAFLWICYTCSVFLLPTYYPIKWDTFNYAPVALGVCLTLIMLWWILDARKWFEGPVRNIDGPNEKV